MPRPIPNRIQGHRRVRASDLVPREFDFRLHPEHHQADDSREFAECGNDLTYFSMSAAC